MEPTEAEKQKAREIVVAHETGTWTPDENSVLEDMISAALAASRVEGDELHRMRLTAIECIALANTRHSRGCHLLVSDSPYRTPAYEATVKAVGREIQERERAESAEAQLSAVTAERDALTGKSLEWKCRALAAESANAEMRAALKPFAAVEPVESLLDGETFVVVWSGSAEWAGADKRLVNAWSGVTAGDLRRASSLLAGGEPKAEVAGTVPKCPTCQDTGREWAMGESNEAAVVIEYMGPCRACSPGGTSCAAVDGTAGGTGGR